MERVGNITDEAVQKYMKEQTEESMKEDKNRTALKGGLVIRLCTHSFWHGSNRPLLGTEINHQLRWRL